MWQQLIRSICFLYNEHGKTEAASAEADRTAPGGIP